jgi:hypothetical protein
VSDGARVFVDQAAEDGFAVDPFAVEVGYGEVATVGDALGDALWGSRTGPLWLTWAFYAARSYSLRRPPSTGRRLTRTWERSATG